MSRKKAFGVWLLSAVVIMLLSSIMITPAESETDFYVIYGTVSDVKGQALSGVTVTLTNSRAGYVLNTTTAADGSYSFTLGGLGGYDYQDGDVVVIKATATTEKTGGETVVSYSTTIIADGRVGEEVNLRFNETAGVPTITIPAEYTSTTAMIIYAIIAAVVVVGVLLVVFVYTGNKTKKYRI